MNRNTIFSPCRKYRYTLWREWDCDLITGCADDLPNAHSYVQFIGLNPSTADEVQDDPTIRRCIGYAKAWGFGALCMTNIFAWRDTLPENMKKSVEPVGADNDKWLLETAKDSGSIICAWGKHGSYLNRGNAVRKLLKDFPEKVHYLGLNGDGSPKHPLYLGGNLKPILATS